MNKKISIIGYRKKIILYFERELRFYEKIEVLTREQREVIQSGDVKKIGLLITEKENCVKELKQWMNYNAKIVDGMSCHTQTLNSDNTIKSLLRKKQSLLITLLQYDQESIDLLITSMDGMKREAGSLGKRSKILNTLKFQQTHPPRYLDTVQ